MRTLMSVLFAVLLLAGAANAQFTLTLLHNNDGESQLINLGGDLEDFGGVAHFASLADSCKAWADANTDGYLMVTSGDNFLPGPEWNASLNDGIYYDAVAIDLLGYNTLCLGNHDFDAGPDALAEFIDEANVYTSPTWLSCNLDFSNEPNLQAHVDNGRIASSRIIDVNGTLVGIVGATTPNLDFISSPGDVIINDDVVAAVQTEIDDLSNNGAEIIILISHLQGIVEDLAIIPELSGLDVAVAGGGDELLANDGDLLVPGDDDEVYGAYPLTATNLDGDLVPVVTTSGNYAYLGQIVLNFDANGDLVDWDANNSGPKRVANENHADGVPANTMMQTMVVDPVAAYVANLGANIIANSDVDLDGIRNHVRGFETNQGNLIADAMLAVAMDRYMDFGAPMPTVAFQNGGGIRNDAIISAGDISELNTFDILPFGNILSIVEDVDPMQFKAIMENHVAAINGGSGTGRFGQVAGYRFEYDATFQAQEYDTDGNITTPGERVRNAWLADGTVLVEDGVVNMDAPHQNIVVGDFIAGGGDEYPFQGLNFTRLGISDQQTLATYLSDMGTVLEKDYPRGGEMRVVRLDQPLDLEAGPMFGVMPTVPAEGGYFPLTATISNLTADEMMYDAWVDVWGPSGLQGEIHSGVKMYMDVTIFGNAMDSYNAVQFVPGYAPEGIWLYIVNIGHYPNEVIARDWFGFVKEGIDPSATGDWMIKLNTGDVEATDAATVSELPTEFAVGQAYPNPFNPTTTLSVSLPEAARLSIAVFNVMGQQVAEIANGSYTAGTHNLVFDANGLGSGVYFVRTQVPGHLNQLQKVMLVR
ncbi:5'-nucleotidase C-terminal domain-containing protein [bacterium]|nr:5'-nucleotidase C-terminal domain-containing protein [bacterium]